MLIGVAMQLGCARNGLVTDSSVGALVQGAWGLRRVKFHRNLTISSFRAVGMCHETVWRPIHPSGVLVHGARGLVARPPLFGILQL